MKVRILVSRAGLDFAQNTGDVVEVAAAEGKSLIEAGQAEAVAEKRQAKAETRVTEAKETR